MSTQYKILILVFVLNVQFHIEEVSSLTDFQDQLRITFYLHFIRTSV